MSLRVQWNRIVFMCLTVADEVLSVNSVTVEDSVVEMLHKCLCRVVM